jgi:hypothetical protein
MKKFILSAVLLLVAANISDAGGGPFSVYPGQQQKPGPFARFFGQQPMPAFQAAPWYLYYPYNAHFMTPAPLTGAFYAPPVGGGTQSNPYFPAQSGR